MSKVWYSNVLVALFSVVAMGNPVVPDSHTVILDQLNGSSTGQNIYSVSYGAGMSSYGQAGYFGNGSHIVYNLPSSGVWNQQQGTIEMWVMPESHGVGINFNWYFWETPPMWDGNVLHFYEYSVDNTLKHTVWNGPVSTLSSTSQLTLGTWNHIATSWGPAGTKMYLNGQVVASTAGNYCPSPGSYVYLNYHGDRGFQGYIDELHISDIQRSDAEILAHAPEPVTSLLLAVGALGVISRRRRV